MNKIELLKKGISSIIVAYGILKSLKKDDDYETKETKIINDLSCKLESATKKALDLANMYENLLSEEKTNIKANYSYIKEVKSLNRALEIAKSIKNLWYETYEDKIEGEYGVSFGYKNGYVIYNYNSSNPNNIITFIKEISNDSDN